MPWDSCIITLNSDSTGSLYCGDVVTGYVRLLFKQSQKIDNIEFLVYGRCKAHWTRSHPVTPFIRFYSQKKKILYININVFENIEGTTVTEGVYDFPFHFILPPDLPSSFESFTGKVNYWIKIKSGGSSADLPFVVLSNVNLNHVEKYMEPSNHEIQKEFSNSGKVALNIRTYTGFASNQPIPIELLLENEKSVKIYSISVTLVQKLHFSVTEGFKDEEKKICKVEHTKFLNIEREIFKLMMEIPHVIPSSIHTTDPMIGVCYVLRVALKFTYHLTVHKDIPVTVAAVPVLHSEFDEYV